MIAAFSMWKHSSRSVTGKSVSEGVLRGFEEMRAESSLKKAVAEGQPLPNFAEFTQGKEARSLEVLRLCNVRKNQPSTCNNPRY